MPFPFFLLFVGYLTGDVFLSDFLLGGGDCLSSNDLLDEVLATDLTEEASDSVVNFLPAGGGCICSRSLFCLLVCTEVELVVDTDEEDLDVVASVEDGGRKKSCLDKGVKTNI